MKRLLYIFFILYSTSSFSQEINVDKIDRYLTYFEKENRAVGSVSIFKEGEEVYHRDFGQNNIPELKFDSSTKYRVGSVTKLITSTLIMHYVAEGNISLENRLSVYFPQIPNAENITLLDLLEHRSGLGDYAMKNKTTAGWLKKEVSHQEILQEIIAQGVQFESGDDFLYSNSGYYLLAKIVEQISGISYGKAVEQIISKPLGLQNFVSYALFSQNAFDSYHYRDYKWNKIEEFQFENIIGAGDLHTTLYDLNVFINGLFKSKILSKEIIEGMKPHGNSYFGKSLMMVHVYEDKLYGHGGDTYGTSSFVAYDEKKDISVAMSVNAFRHMKDEVFNGIFFSLYDLDYPYPVFQNTEALSKYVGHYQSIDQDLKVEVKEESETLILEFVEENSIPIVLYYTGENEYVAKSNAMHLKFEANKLIISQDKERVAFLKQ